MVHPTTMIPYRNASQQITALLLHTITFLTMDKRRNKSGVVQTKRKKLRDYAHDELARDALNTGIKKIQMPRFRNLLDQIILIRYPLQKNVGSLSKHYTIIPGRANRGEIPTQGGVALRMCQETSSNLNWKKNSPLKYNAADVSTMIKG